MSDMSIHNFTVAGVDLEAVHLHHLPCQLGREFKITQARYNLKSFSF